MSPPSHTGSGGNTSDRTLGRSSAARRGCDCQRPELCGSNGASTSWKMHCGHSVDQFCVERALLSAPMMYLPPRKSHAVEEGRTRSCC